MKRFLSVFLVSISLVQCAPKVVHLTPPIITPETLGEELSCTRPMRLGKFNISVDEIGSKTVVHCYGHGGSGCTTLFGSVNYALKLFDTKNIGFDKPIRVIGSGCMGLLSAIELKRMGYNVVGITTKELYDLPSWRAAGYFALVSVKTSPEEQETLNEIGMNTFLAYKAIEEGKHLFISSGAVRYLPVYCSVDTEAGVEDLEARGLIPPRQEVTLDFGNGVVHEGFYEYMSYYINTSLMMSELLMEVERLGIPIEMREVLSFDDVAEEIIFNCTGMGARALNHDETVIPVLGHLISLNENAGSGHLDYMIYTKVEQDGKDEYIYMFPKTKSVTSAHIDGVPAAGILGGTFIPNVDQLSPEEQAALNRRENDRMLERNSLFFSGASYKARVKGCLEGDG
jgi:hypothetical protein